MSAEVISITSRLEAAWSDYIAATARAQNSLEMCDGIAAGRAYRRWLDLFLTEEQRQKIGLAK